MDTFQFADIIILALIAGFIALRLRNTLGKDIGHRPDVNQLRQQISKDMEERVIPLPGMRAPVEEKEVVREDKAFDALSAQMKDKIAEIRKYDAAFNLSEFMEGAKGAFEWVFKAFNEGDKSTLKQLLSPELYQEFEEAMVDRLSSGARADGTLVAITRAELSDARVKGQAAQLTVKFESDQVHVVRNDKDEVISGNASEIARVEDEWVFERSLKSRDPNWTIIDS